MLPDVAIKGPHSIATAWAAVVRLRKLNLRRARQAGLTFNFQPSTVLIATVASGICNIQYRLKAQRASQEFEDCPATGGEVGRRLSLTLIVFGVFVRAISNLSNDEEWNCTRKVSDISTGFIAQPYGIGFRVGTAEEVCED